VTDKPFTLSRRRLMELSAMGAAGAAIGSSSGLLAPGAASAHGTIVSRSEIWDARLYYEPTGAASSFGFEPNFYNRLETWMSFWYYNTPSSYLKPLKLHTYGAHTDHRVSTAHNSGRGFDLSRIYATVNGSSYLACYARYDIWKSWSSYTVTRKRYWPTSASLNYHFRHVLHYLYNSDHWNHFHIDNLISGSGNSQFSTSSTPQVKHVQACLNYIWGYATTIDGIWGSQTSGNASKALARMGRSGTLTTSQTNWLEFNRGTMRFGYGTQTY